MKRGLLLCLMLGALPVSADPVIDRTLDRVVLPALHQFRDATADLSEAAKVDCRAETPALRAAWNAAFDAWIPASYFHSGPMEAEGRNLAIAFWPDPKGATPRTLARLLKDNPPSLSDGAAYGRVSVAARGFPALEAMLYDPAFNDYGAEDPGCRLVRAATEDLAATSAAITDDWEEGFANALRSAGVAGNQRFLSVREGRQYLYTSLLGGLQFDEEQRLARPLGTLDRPRPERAEARASGRSLQNVRLSLAAARTLGENLSDGATELTFTYLDYAIEVADGLSDPVFADVADPTGRFRIQDLKDAIHRVRETAMQELGPELGVSAGFNALDGD